MKIKHLGIGTKLALSFAFVIAMLIALASLSFLRLQGLSEDIRLTNEDRYPKTVLAHRIKDEVNEQARNMRNLLLMSEPDELRKEHDSIANSSRATAAGLAQLARVVKTEQGRKELEQLEAMRSAFLRARDSFLDLARGGSKADALRALLADVRPRQLAYMNKLDELLAFQQQLMEASGKQSAAQAQQTELLIVALALAAAVVAGALALLTTRAITRPLQAAVAVARRVADGDLTAHIEVQSEDETGQLLAALKDMNAALTRIVGEVRSGTDTIATASGQIASGNLDLSSRTEQQASALEETASSMEQLTATVKHNADNARQASQLAVSASDLAAKGGAVVARVVQTMGQISDSSHRIVDIISVIDGIAFQTNILALNAAVEAARAGDQGRGFAVVASEVRNLAQRSAAAAKEIKQLIDDSAHKVDSGAQLVGEAGSTMQVIVSSIRSVADIMGEITAASAEQTAGIEQINQAVAQMDEVTQQNAALVEEAAAAASAMQDQSARLVEVVSVFKTSTQAPAPPPGLPALAAARSPRGQVQLRPRAARLEADQDWVAL